MRGFITDISFNTTKHNGYIIQHNTTQRIYHSTQQNTTDISINTTKHKYRPETMGEHSFEIRTAVRVKVRVRVRVRVRVTVRIRVTD